MNGGAGIAMPNFIDITGQRFGRLVALEIDNDNSRHGINKWVCRCDCGNYKSVWIGSLRRGQTQSCGCLQKERTSNASKTHGIGYENRLYRIWRGIKRRCLCHTAQYYINYGGRGIGMCEDWQKSFMSFYSWAITNGYDDRLTIDRINNDGDYCPENCRWTDRKTQAQNSRHAHNITIDGSTKCVKDWIDDLGISESIGRSWLRNGEKSFVHNYKIVKLLQNYPQ